MKFPLAAFLFVATAFCAAAYAGRDEAVLRSVVAAALPSSGERFTSIRTAGGTLLCATDLCITTRKPAPAGGKAGGLRSSEHLVRLTRHDPPVVLQCDEARSDDILCIPVRHHDYAAAGAALPGVRLVVPGDGCIYAEDDDSSQPRTMRKYCETADGILVDRGSAGTAWLKDAPGA